VFFSYIYIYFSNFDKTVQFMTFVQTNWDYLCAWIFGQQDPWVYSRSDKLRKYMAVFEFQK